MAQELYELPEGWEWRKFKDVCQLKRGYDLPKQSRVEGLFPLFSANGVTDYIDQFKVKAPGVVTGRSGTIGKVHFVDHDFWPLNTALYVQDFKGNDERFILFFLKAFDLIRFSSGAAVPTLNRNSLSSELVYIPDSIDEQKRIVAKLDALFTRIDTAISHLQQTLKLCKALFASALDEAFEINDKSGRTIEEATLLISGQHLNKSEYTEVEILGSIPYLTGPAEFGDITPKPSRWTSIRRAIALSGDTLITVKGSGVGKVNMMIAPEIAISRQLMAVRSKGQLDQDYLHFFFKARQQVFADKKTGAAIPGIGRKDVLEQVIPIPSLDEQTQMVFYLDALSERTRFLENTTQEKLNDLTALKASLLDAAFKGQL